MIGAVIGVPATAYLLAPVTEEATFTPVDLGPTSRFTGEAGFKPSVPQGSYYMLAEIPEEFRDSAEAAQALLEQARVASVPGTAFFESVVGKRMLRFCYAKDFDALEEACKRIREFHVGRVLQPARA